jgi:hypothetical protein
LSCGNPSQWNDIAGFYRQFAKHPYCACKALNRSKDEFMTDQKPVARHWPIILWAAAAYNFLIGVPGLFAVDAGVQARLVSLLVTCFGLLYALIARDPARLGPALWSGVAGKIGVVAIMMPAVLSGKLPAAMGAILAGDALFTVAFLVFLLRKG